MVLKQNQTYSSVDRIESLEINTHIYGQLIYERRQEYTMEKRECLQQVVMGKLDSFM